MHVRIQFALVPMHVGGGMAGPEINRPILRMRTYHVAIPIEFFKNCRYSYVLGTSSRIYFTSILKRNIPIENKINGQSLKWPYLI